MKNIEKTLSAKMAKNINRQYNDYKIQVAYLMNQYELEKNKGKDISKILQKMKDDNMIDSHLSKLFLLAQGKNVLPRSYNNQKNLDKVTQYFQEIQDLSVKSLKLIFEIRKFFTGQEFDIYLESKGEIFSFSVNDIEKVVGGLIPTYTDSLEKYIDKIAKDTRGMGFELNKLGLSLTNLSKDIRKVEGIQPYLEFVNYHIKKNKITLSENRKLEAAIYLFTRDGNVDFKDKSNRQSLHILLGQYIARGGTSDTIAMYKLGDAIQQTEEGFKNIEIKMHSGTISLTMIANGIKKLYEAFNSENPQEKMEKFFSARKQQLSNPIEKAALEEVAQSIREIFSYIH